MLRRQVRCADNQPAGNAIELDERQGIVPKGKFKVEDLYTDEFNPYATKPTN